MDDSVNEDAFRDGDGWDETLARVNLDFNEDRRRSRPVATGPRTYTYKNVRIQFPYKAYRSQERMMEKIIEGVTTGENCLLESPTGTGKTAALLCALLAWRRDCVARGDSCAGVIKAAVERMEGCTCGLISDPEKTRVILVKSKKEENAKVFKKTTMFLQATTAVAREATTDNPGTSSNLDENDNLPTPAKRPKQTEEVEVQQRAIDDACAYCVRKYVVDKSSPPKIYYLTRTHSQIAQVVKQLKATAYSNAKMTILAGRERTCISEKTLKFADQNQNSGTGNEDFGELKLTVDDICRSYKKKRNQGTDCEKMLSFVAQKPRKESEENGIPKSKQGMDPPDNSESCKYYQPMEELVKKFANFHNQGAWDVEDIKAEGQNCDTCPFYGSKALHESSEIAFGSYNYLLQPAIRNAANIKYVNSVIVFDEAHNIEDICRDVFSISVDTEQIDRFRLYIDKLHLNATGPHASILPSTIDGLKHTATILKQWSDLIKERGNMEIEKLKKKKKTLTDEFKNPYESDQLHKFLIEMSMTEESVTKCIVMLGGENGETESTNSAPKEEEYYFDSFGNQQPFRVSSTFIDFLKKLRQTLKYLFGKEKEGIGGTRDFKGYLTGKMKIGIPSKKLQRNDSRRCGQTTRGNLRQSELQVVSSNQVILAEPKLVPPEVSDPEYVFTFQIICLNPAIGFRVLRNTAYSIIVTSGTLTPLSSFASELATKFSVRLQAQHVIPESNVWTGVITYGPRNERMLLNKDNQAIEAVQDDLGRIIRDICLTVPNGVLVFFPSYTLMSKLESRWRTFPEGNSIMHQIALRKRHFTEQSKDKNAFKLMMQQYQENVTGGCKLDGCVLFAVFRGKISEGVDFADEQARAVVTIGIPFSSVFSPETVSKKAYNNMRKKTQKPGEYFLTGNEWYATQAFRALNQAFGRCVRHCNDWGAVILIDSRIKDKRQYISGWVEKNLKCYANFDEAKSTLAKFMAEMKVKNKPRKIQIAYEQSASPEDQQRDSIMTSQDDKILTQAVVEMEGSMNPRQVSVVCAPPSHRDFFESRMSHVTPAAASFNKNGNCYIGETSKNQFVTDTDSDEEISLIADSMETSLNEQDQSQVDAEQDGISGDVSMPSAQNSEYEQMSQSQESNFTYFTD